MRKYLFVAALAVLALVGTAPAYALMIAPPQPAQMAINAPVVVTGKVTAIEKETVDATAPYVGAKEKQTYTIAVVKINDALSGANNLTHIKIGFIPPAKAQPGGVKPVPVAPGQPMILPAPGRPIRPGFQNPELKVGQEALFFLSKHPTADFYIIPNMNNPVDVSTDAGKKQLEEVKKITSIIADPMKGLKSDKADVRTETAATMVQKYRSYPMFGGEVDNVAINAEESKLILKALAEADWKQVRPGFGTPNPMNAFYQLGLTDKDGWVPPKFVRPQPGQPPVDFTAVQKDAFVKWLAGPGKDYVIKKVVAKKTEK